MQLLLYNNSVEWTSPKVLSNRSKWTQLKRVLTKKESHLYLHQIRLISFGLVVILLEALQHLFNAGR